MAIQPSWQSSHRQGDRGQEDFAGLRARQPSDPPRHIAWKTAARDTADRPLLIKQFAGGAKEERWLDWSRIPADSDTEKRLSILTGWVLAADQQQLCYGLRLPERTLQPTQGRAHRNACLETLARHGRRTAEAAGGGSLPLDRAPPWLLVCALASAGPRVEHLPLWLFAWHAWLGTAGAR